MRRGKFTSALSSALIVAAGMALGAASPPIQSSTMPPVGAGHVEIDQLKMLSERMQRLEQDNAMKAAQIATLNAQISAMKTSMNLMQAAITTLQNRANASVPVAAPGNCATAALPTCPPIRN